jgi:hypothetical protein
MFVIFPSPHPRALAHPITFKVPQVKEHALTPFFFVVFTLNSHLNLLKSLGTCQLC